MRKITLDMDDPDIANFPRTVAQTYINALNDMAGILEKGDQRTFNRGEVGTVLRFIAAELGPERADWILAHKALVVIGGFCQIPDCGCDGTWHE